jgi:hypothetical protein
MSSTKIVGKFTQDTGDTAPPPPQHSTPSREISELYEIYRQLGKNGPNRIWSDGVVAKAARLKSGGQFIECSRYAFFFLWISQIFLKGGGLNAFGNFRRKEG